MNEREYLIEELIGEGFLKSPALIKAFKNINRADFILPQFKNQAYVNYPLPILSGQTISQPATVAFMLELLEVEAGQKILEVGSGSGWQTAMLAELVGLKGKIFALEINRPLIEFSQNNLKKYDFTNVSVRLGNGWQGLPEEAPFDRIIVAAGATEIPPVLKNQLAIDGRLVIPVGKIEQTMILLERKSEQEYSQTSWPGFIFVPLVKK